MYNAAFFKAKPTDWLLSRISLSALPDTITADINEAISKLNFVYRHVGGMGTNSPNRGVCVRSIVQEGFETGHWTLTQNKSQCSLSTPVEPMSEELQSLVPFLREISEEHFPDCPLNSASFSLFVANEYLPGHDHTICAHKDDQDWYPFPPIFASVTVFPDGCPESPDHTARFQVYDEGDKKWKDLYLPHCSICMMRADIVHRVKPPLHCKPDAVKRRINLTYRNLQCPLTDPFGYFTGISNHHRYYGIPSVVTIPKGFSQEDISDVIDGLRRISPKIIVRKDYRTNTKRNKHKSNLRVLLTANYKSRQREIDSKMLSKSNIVLELLEVVRKQQISQH